MSRVMKQLNQSQFKGYEAHSKPEKKFQANANKGSSLAMNLLLVFIPSLIVAAVIAYQQGPELLSKPNVETEKHKVHTSLELNSRPNDDAELSQSDTIASSNELTDSKLQVAEHQFNVRSAPLAIQLKPLPRRDVYAHITSPKESDEQALNASDNLTLVARPNDTQTEVNNHKPSEHREEEQTVGDSDLLQGLDLTELSPELALKIESAMKGSSSEQQPETLWDRNLEVVKLELNSHEFSGRLPSLNLQTHMYSSSENRRWVKVNGKEVGQGDWINDEVKVVEIKPQAIVVEFQRQKIEIPALYEWQG